MLLTSTTLVPGSKRGRFTDQLVVPLARANSSLPIRYKTSATARLSVALPVMTGVSNRPLTVGDVMLTVGFVVSFGGRLALPESWTLFRKISSSSTTRRVTVVLPETATAWDALE